MRKLVTYLFLFVLGIVLVVFFVANRQDVKISMDPTSLDDPAFFVGPMPMWAALAGTLVIGYGLGLVGMWLSDSALRRRARERKDEIRRLKAELALAAGDRPVENSSKLPALRG